ncbi:MAG TPA: glycosyltransferase family 4 protein [Oligoflexus sp.]|uniref:glycosyltransferase family 4 protein n=1 Tax=Oligoflexus sp. TaxID=1971216 RepID=UPI002D471B46|nr:glycosyltransferase family 4 protein [Oligoflexus sp.]HYX31495.1 glycosyltransferase family 4 protein [Oligoflexus sp.]
MRKTRVLFLSKPYVAASYRQKLRLMAQDPRFEIGLIVPLNWAGQDFEESSEPEEYWIRKLPIAFNGHNHFHFYRGLDAAVREFRPDIFNVEEEHYSLVTAQAVSLARKYGAASCFYTWQNIHKKYPPPFSWIERYVFRSTALAIAGNAEAIAILRKKGFQKKALVLPQMGADTDALQKIQDTVTMSLREELKLPREAFIVTFAGRLVEEKGIQHLIQALARLQEPMIFLVILGSGPYQEELMRQAQEAGVAQYVLFTGSKKSVEVYRYLKESDVLALPSLTRANWKEQFGRILVEAMLSGAVVIGSDSGEIPRVIRGGGLIFPEGQVSALAERIRILFKDRRLHKKLAERGHKRALNHYTNTVIASRTLDLMQELITQPVS